MITVRFPSLARGLKLFSAVCLPLPALSVAAAAQTSQVPSDVRVVGKPETEVRSTREFARAISQATSNQLARFQDSVCFGTVGFNPPYDRKLEERMAQTARGLGIRVAHDGCTPNVIFGVADDVRGSLEALLEESRTRSVGVSTSELKRLSASAGPAYVVTLTETRSSDGDRLTARRLGVRKDAPSVATREASLFRPAVRQDILGALVMIDRSAVLGKTLTQIGDYAVFRSLARLRSREVATKDPTILTLFTAPQPVRALTAFDRRYITALYRGPANESAPSKISEIARGVGQGTK